MDRLPEEVRVTATSVKAETGVEVSNEEFLEYMLRDYEKMYKATRSGARNVLAREYMALCSTIRQKVEVTTPDAKVRGTAVEVTPAGGPAPIDGGGRRVVGARGSSGRALG